jgi:hypothetical protein
MSSMDAIVEFCLYMLDGVLDGVLDVITFGRWSQWQGAKVPSVKVKKVQ